MNLDDVKKQRPTLGAKTSKAPRRRNEGTVTMEELRRRFGLSPDPEPAPPPPPKG